MYLLVGSVIVCLLGIQSLAVRGLPQEAVQGDGGIVCPEDLHTQPVHQLLQSPVEVMRVHGLEQLVLRLLGCTHAALFWCM